MEYIMGNTNNKFQIKNSGSEILNYNLCIQLTMNTFINITEIDYRTYKRFKVFYLNTKFNSAFVT